MAGRVESNLIAKLDIFSVLVSIICPKDRGIRYGAIRIVALPIIVIDQCWTVPMSENHIPHTVVAELLSSDVLFTVCYKLSPFPPMQDCVENICIWFSDRKIYSFFFFMLCTFQCIFKNV